MVSFGSGAIVILFFEICILIEAFLSCNNVVKSPRNPLSLTLRRNVKAVTPDTNPTHKAKGSSIYSASTQKHRSPSNIEQMQKMQDEFYKPKKKEEELEDGELPSLSRTGSNPKRPVAYWNQDEPALLRNFLLHLRGVSPPLIPATRPTHAIRNASKSPAFVVNSTKKKNHPTTNETNSPSAITKTNPTTNDDGDILNLPRLPPTLSRSIPTRAKRRKRTPIPKEVNGISWNKPCVLREKRKMSR